MISRPGRRGDRPAVEASLEFYSTTRTFAKSASSSALGGVHLRFELIARAQTVSRRAGLEGSFSIFSRRRRTCTVTVPASMYSTPHAFEQLLGV